MAEDGRFVIILGAYPESVELGPLAALGPIAATESILDRVDPSRACVLHLLPFHPSDGDGGFSARDWSSVDPRYGSWADIASIARKRRLIVDTIFNHIGVNSDLVHSALRDPVKYASVLHMYSASVSDGDSVSPRGGSVFEQSRLGADVGHRFWQTFGPSAVDLRLESNVVRNLISEHLDRLAEHQVWGIRLDAAAYYGKRLGDPQFHHPLAKEHVSWIVGEASRRGLECFPQLDSDERGLAYFPSPSSIPVVDYAYSAMAIAAVMTQQLDVFVEYLRATATLAPRLVRSIRNHDGVLLRSRRFVQPCLSPVLEFCEVAGIPVRYSNGTPYELNMSLPALCRRVLGYRTGRGTLTATLVRTLIALTLFVSGWPYIYLPSLLLDEPEQRSGTTRDPRETNRRPVPLTDIDEACSDAKTDCFSLAPLFRAFASASVATDGSPLYHVRQVSDRVLVVHRPDARIMGVFNLSADQEFGGPVPARCKNDSLGAGDRFVQLGPCSYQTFGVGTEDSE